MAKCLEHFYRYYISVVVTLFMVFLIQRSPDQFSICTVLFMRPQRKFLRGTVFCFQKWQKEMIFRESMQPELLYSLGIQNCCITFYQGIQSGLILSVFAYAWIYEFHKIVEVGVDVWMSSGPTLPLCLSRAT